MIPLSVYSTPLNLESVSEANLKNLGANEFEVPTHAVIVQSMCPKLDGKSEFQQLRTMIKMAIHKHNLMNTTFLQMIRMFNSTVRNPYARLTAEDMAPQQYNYAIDMHLTKLPLQKMYMAIIHVKEKRKNKLTEGGSAFRTSVVGPSTVSRCPYKDFFNGSYLICCEIREKMSEINHGC